MRVDIGVNLFDAVLSFRLFLQDLRASLMDPLPKLESRPLLRKIGWNSRSSGYATIGSVSLLKLLEA